MCWTVSVSKWTRAVGLEEDLTEEAWATIGERVFWRKKKKRNVRKGLRLRKHHMSRSRQDWGWSGLCKSSSKVPLGYIFIITLKTGTGRCQFLKRDATFGKEGKCNWPLPPWYSIKLRDSSRIRWSPVLHKLFILFKMGGFTVAYGSPPKCWGYRSVPLCP